MMQDNLVYKGQANSLLSPFLEEIRLDKISKHIVGNRILDFGCGYGKLATYIRDKQYVGVDCDQRAIELARKLNRDSAGIYFYSMDEFENETGKFDTIIMAAVIEHLDNPYEILLNMRGHLKEGGRIIITTPTPIANKILRFGSKLRLFSKDAVNEHKSLFTKKDFINISFDIDIRLEIYERFEFGLNQLVIYVHEA